MKGPKISVVGAGLMGHGIAQVFACAEYPVSVTDHDAAVLANVTARIRSSLHALGTDPVCLEAISLHPRIEDAVADADVIFEAVVEDVAVKRDVVARISRSAPGHAIIATNTSVIAIGDIAAAADDAGRVVGAHWWNPPYLIPLVEVTQGDSTHAATVRQLMNLLEDVGKRPVHVRKDVPGFIGNRLQHAMWREAFALVEAGVCEAAEIDHVVKASFGVRLAALGPMENADLVGLDLTLAIHRYLFPHLNSSPEPAHILETLVREGKLGMKSGQGLRTWTSAESDAVLKRMTDHLLAARQAGGLGRTENERSGPAKTGAT